MAKGDSGGNPLANMATTMGSGLGSSSDLYSGGMGVGPSQNVAQAIQDIMSRGTSGTEQMTPFQRMLQEYDRSRIVDRNTYGSKISDHPQSRDHIVGETDNAIY